MQLVVKPARIAGDTAFSITPPKRCGPCSAVLASHRANVGLRGHRHIARRRRTASTRTFGTLGAIRSVLRCSWRRRVRGLVTRPNIPSWLQLTMTIRACSPVAIRLSRLIGRISVTWRLLLLRDHTTRVRVPLLGSVRSLLLLRPRSLPLPLLRSSDVCTVPIVEGRAAVAARFAALTVAVAIARAAAHWRVGTLYILCRTNSIATTAR